MTYGVNLSRRAQRDVDGIYDWLTKRSPVGATRWYTSFHKAIKSLEADADGKGTAPETEEFRQPVRQILFRTRKGRTYRALFVVEGDEVKVLTVRGSGQPPLAPEDLFPLFDE